MKQHYTVMQANYGEEYNVGNYVFTLDKIQTLLSNEDFLFDAELDDDYMQITDYVVLDSLNESKILEVYLTCVDEPDITTTIDFILRPMNLL